MTSFKLFFGRLVTSYYTVRQTMKKEDKERKEFLKKLGQAVIKAREQKGWSQAELARNCYKDRQSIERLENGKINPSAFYLQEVAKGLGLKFKDLMNFF